MIEMSTVPRDSLVQKGKPAAKVNLDQMVNLVKLAHDCLVRIYFHMYVPSLYSTIMWLEPMYSMCEISHGEGNCGHERTTVGIPKGNKLWLWIHSRSINGTVHYYVYIATIKSCMCTCDHCVMPQDQFHICICGLYVLIALSIFIPVFALHGIHVSHLLPFIGRTIATVCTSLIIWQHTKWRICQCTKYVVDLSLKGVSALSTSAFLHWTILHKMCIASK